MSCLLIALVIGYNRVPLPPARMIPFISLSRYRVFLSCCHHCVSRLKYSTYLSFQACTEYLSITVCLPAEPIFILQSLFSTRSESISTHSSSVEGRYPFTPF